MQYEQILLQAGASVVIVFFFLSYLAKRDVRDAKMLEEFNQTINTHIKESTAVQKQLAIKLQEFSDSNKELRQTLGEVYKWNKKLIDEKSKKGKKDIQ